MEQIRIDSAAAAVECIVKRTDAFDEIALRMIQNNQIEQLVTPAVYDEETSLLKYPISGKVSFHDLLSQEEDWVQIRELLLTICGDTHQNLKEYMLFHNQIYYDPQFIYVNQGKVQYIYIPEKASSTYTLKQMLQTVLADNKWNQGGNRAVFAGVIQYLETISWLTGKEKEQFMEMLSNLDVQLPESTAQEEHLAEEEQTEMQQAKNEHTAAPEPKGPYLIRQKTKEKIPITTDYFRIGKQAQEVEYAISGNSSISRRHAVLVKKGSNYYIMDTNSKNRTYVDGRVIFPNQREILIHETRVRMGDEEFIFYLR